MIDYVDDFLTPQHCAALVREFKEMPNLHERVDHGGLPTFTQLNMTANGMRPDLQQDVVNAVIGRVDKLRNIHPHLPRAENFEQLRIKKYEAGSGDRFDTHVDVGNYASARRYLAVQIYLNTVQKGGATEFVMNTIEPVVGRCLMFPPTWEYPHRGLPAVSEDKYILTTYLHYV